MGIVELATGEYEHEFGLLLDAVLHEPQKVRSIVAANRDILSATNRCGENVLKWLAVENHVEGVTLLRSLGSSIPESALWEAMQMGHTDMVILLLELGAEVDVEVCKRTLSSKLWGLDKKKIRLMTSYLKQFGYEL